MKFIIEFEGVIADTAPMYFEVHRQIAAEVGWSALDQETFWRLTRTKGREAHILPGAKPVKVKEYYARFDERIEADEVVERLIPRREMDEILRRLMRYGECRLVTLGSNLAIRRRILDRSGLARYSAGVGSFNADARLRSGELTAMAGGDRRTLVVAATDSLIRAAGRAELLTVGVASGACSVARLKQAGADVVYHEFSELADSLASGAQDLLQAGLPPVPLGWPPQPSR